MRLAATLSLAFLSVSIPAAQRGDQQDLQRRFEEAERRIVRLPPAAFPELPANLVRELQRRGCTVPQAKYFKQPHNVIQGSFAKPGQKDWAVLCSVRDVSTILVFWGGAPDNTAELATDRDSNHLQVVDAEAPPHYCRAIRLAEHNQVTALLKDYTGAKPSSVRHQGIEDADIEKLSKTWYFHAGRWLELVDAEGAE